jgi:formamidopyrimidine-DNA glycosylase
VLAGVGNIIATEALWKVKIDPRARAKRLSRAEIASLARAMKDEIRREMATRAKATSDEWTDELSIYGRAGKACPRCRATIASAVVGGRTSAYCPKCQTIGRTKRRA